MKNVVCKYVLMKNEIYPNSIFLSYNIRPSYITMFFLQDLTKRKGSFLFHLPALLLGIHRNPEQK